MDRSYARRASAIQVTTGTRIDWLLTFFLGLQVTRTDDGIFISQDKYVDEEVWFFNCEDSKPDIMFVVCPYARVQVTPKLSHLHVVKRIFRYLKGQPKLGLWSRLISWQCKKQTVVANSTTEAEYVAASNYYEQIKHIEIRHHFIRDSNEKKLIQISKIHTDQNVADLLTKAFDDVEWNATTAEDRIEVKTGNSKVNAVGPYLVLLGKRTTTEPQPTPLCFTISLLEQSPTIASSSHPKKTHKRRKTKRKATKISQSSGPTTLVADETIHEERGDSMERAATTAISLDAEQGSGNIIRTQSMATLNEPIPQGTGSGSGPRRQDTILGDRPAQTRFERLSKQSNDPPLSRVNTLRSGEDSMKLNELMEICTKLSERVLALENIKTAQDLEITNLKKRVKKLEKKKKVKNSTTQEEVIQRIAPTTIAGVSVSTTKPSTPPLTTTTLIEDEDLTIAQTLMKMRSVKSKEKSKKKGVSSETATRLTRGQLDLKDKGKGIMQELEKLVKVKDEEVMLEIEREEEASNAALIEEWDTIKARIDADAQLAERLQAEEREQMFVEERARPLMEFIAARKKFFAAKRAEEQRNKPPTKAEQRKKLCTYMKHIAG
ncbi:hypothetical protein Tco_0820470 [Tanacetum coccineum]|uniref:Uncharacterized protein n=1 Tax=Tanacetum coccineum TaxID=301880 RepID=A0ABQ5A9I3_9ASTR